MSIPSAIETAQGEIVTVPISFAADGQSVVGMIFSVDYDETCLSIDPTDTDEDLIPDAIRLTVPARFNTSSRSFDSGDTDGEIDYVIGYFAATPRAPLSDSVVGEIDFTVICSPTGIEPIIAPVQFSSNPSASYSNSSGQNVPGTTTDGSVAVIPQVADLAITKTDRPDPVRPGGDIVYHIEITNNGPLDTENEVHFIDTLPEGTTYISHNPPGPGCVYDEPNHEIECNLGVIAAGATHEKFITVRVDPSATPGTILTNTATIVPVAPSDPVSENNSATTETTVGDPDAVPSLSEWGLIGMGGLLLLAFLWKTRTARLVPSRIRGRRID